MEPVDPTAGVGVLAAFAAGLISFLSPCVLPLVPGYLSAVSGVNAADLESASRRSILAPALIFVCTFSLIFILLGLSATAIGSELREHQATLTDVSAVLIIAMGVLFVASPFVARVNREWRVDALMRRAGSGGPLVAGAAFAIAWSPCVGPTLGSILTAAANTDSTGRGGALLAVYSAGLGLPFLATALAFSRASSAFGVVKRHYGVIVAIGGAILIGMGLLILTGGFQELNIEAQKLTRSLGLDY
ncbi:MAG: cytochrome c biogenesis protein CcdA [Actinomycetota bacterium]|nr:cytochrome c biogenesis protein CcdA [Actinomycetota bacterium]